MPEEEFILTDTHTHIYYHANSSKLDEQLQRCFERNIYRLFLPNVDSESIQPVLDTVNAYPQNCFPMLGLHPCSVKENYKEELDIIGKALADNKVYAVGEIGLDLYWDKSTLEIQKDAFRTQVAWAKELNLPIDIHCREAFDELFPLLEELKDEKLFGILHCFTGTLEQAQRGIDLGFALGIGGVVTYKKAGLDAVVREIDLHHLVLETDAPYLAPTPYRGKENESSYLYHVAEKVADLHQISVEELAKITTENSKRIFNI
ncbi:TatD family hydrolase [Sphingobacterium wenxiniae]|uniref:TatD DNase family protein n=1 Tax=Sphingobacterium wenxiniae TaxID=683125 RepID=A0A1I6VM06_9SPHI|nr:TatD family hydrolase [Sphingobacterium wenxiniae]SFT14733.1 TatD DNase family protein [Sphingobacterium wenxiniae]